mmetsp:Transcript_44909/g.112938  ORF Transcript_44909/g.112938 Transcript_44909/m.112938 type:complete len:290 (-) Transcript_44909:115-984(-)
MASLRGLRETDLWDHKARIRYGSKGRLTSTIVLGDPGTPNVFVPVTLTRPRRSGRGGGSSSESRLGKLQRRLVGSAEVGTLPRSPSEGSSRPMSSFGGRGSGSEGKNRDSEVRYVSLGHTVRSAAPGVDEGSPHFPKGMQWYSDSGLHSDMSPLSLQQASYVNHSTQWDIVKPPKTIRDFEKEMHSKRVAAGSGPLMATTTQRSSFVDLSKHKDLVWKQAKRERKEAPSFGPGDRAELTSSGSFRSWSAEEMACAQGKATFTKDHGSVSKLSGSRPATLGRNLHYFLEG